MAVRLAFCFNLRVGELRALTWEDYNEEDGTIHICHQIIKDKVNGHRTWVDVPYTKGNRESGIRTLPVSQEAKSILAPIAGKFKVHRFEMQTDRKLWEIVTFQIQRYLDEIGVDYQFDPDSLKMYSEQLDEMKDTYEQKIKLLKGE